MAEYVPYASKGVAGAGLGLGIAGTALALMGGNLGGLLGGCGRYDGCSENTPVTRFELEQSERLASKTAEVDALRTEIAVNQKITDATLVINDKINNLARVVADLGAGQAVVNQKVTDNFAFLDSRITCEMEKTRAWVAATYVPGELKMPLDSICPKPAVASSAKAA